MTYTIKAVNKRPLRLIRNIESGAEAFRIGVHYFMRIEINEEMIDEDIVDAHKLILDSDPNDAEYWEFIPCVNLLNGELVFIHEDTQAEAEFSANIELTPLT